MNIKSLLLAAVVALLGSASVAEEFHVETGMWDVDRLYNDDGTFVCAATATWGDGSVLGLIVPESDDRADMLMVNTDWNVQSPTGTEFILHVRFIGDRDSENYTGTAHVVDSQTIMIHDLSTEFVADWAVYSRMLMFMPTGMQSVPVDLTGSGKALQSIVDCLGKSVGGKTGTSRHVNERSL